MRSDPAGAGGCPGRASGRPCCGCCAARTLETVSRAPGVAAAMLGGWRDAFLAAGEAALATRPGSGEELAAERLKGRLGEALIGRDLLREKVAALGAGRPLPEGGGSREPAHPAGPLRGGL